MENEVENVEVNNNKPVVNKKAGMGFFVAGIVFALLSVISLVILYTYIANLMKDVDNAGEAIAGIFVAIIFLPLVIGGSGLLTFLSALFSSISFAKVKRSIPRILLFVLSLAEVVAFVLFFIIKR